MNELVRLREENETLKEENRQLRACMRPPAHAPLQWGLTNIQERIFFALLEREKVSKESLLNRVYWDRNDPPLPDVCDVHMVGVRKKTRPYGVKIATIYGYGWGLENRMQWRHRLGL